MFIKDNSDHYIKCFTIQNTPKPFQITFGFPKPPNFGPSEIYGTSVHFRVLGLINKHSIQKISFRYSTPTPLLVVAMVYI